MLQAAPLGDRIGEFAYANSPHGIAASCGIRG